jgi:hypothetical protein
MQFFSIERKNWRLFSNTYASISYKFQQENHIGGVMVSVLVSGFVLDQNAELDFFRASWLKQQSMDRHVASSRHIIQIPSLPVFALSP